MPEPRWDTPSELSDYYAEPAVRARILEFLGVTAGGQPTARFVTTGTGPLGRPFSPLPLDDLWAAVGHDLELARSLWDRNGLLAHLDIEYVHFDRPWEVFTDPTRAFALQQPVVDAVDERLAHAGIAALHVLTGRGHHWSWQISRQSEAFAVLSDLARPALLSCAAYGERPPPAGDVVGVQTGGAYHGLGMVLEGFGHDILRAVETTTEVPVQLTAVTVGPGPRGREIISIDLSAFGDPLTTRTARVPFTAYLKGWRMGRHTSPPCPIPPLVAVPLQAGVPLAEALDARRPERAAAWAAHTTTAPPDGSAGMLRLTQAYRPSRLATFHRWYYATEPEPAARWPETYDHVDVASLPPCVGQVLQQPNDLILHPAALQHVVRTLLTLGWHPRHIAGLVQSKLERDHGWQLGLHFFDAAVRADFYVRLFAGLALVGTDPLIDFNCISAREKSLCPGVGCRWNLAGLRDELRSKELQWATGR